MNLVQLKITQIIIHLLERKKLDEIEILNSLLFAELITM